MLAKISDNKTSHLYALVGVSNACNGGADPTVGKQDILQFKAGVLSTDMTLSCGRTFFEKSSYLKLRRIRTEVMAHE